MTALPKSSKIVVTGAAGLTLNDITLIPLEDLNDGGADGFTSDDLRHAHEEEVVQNRRLYG